MTTGTLVAIAVALALAMGGLVALLSLAGAPSWVMTLCVCIGVLVNLLVMRRMVKPREP